MILVGNAVEYSGGRVVVQTADQFAALSQEVGILARVANSLVQDGLCIALF